MDKFAAEQQILDDFTASYWLKNQIVETDKRDPLDALRDSELLTKIIKQRCIAVGLRENIESHD